jgi:hypothetical protein
VKRRDSKKRLPFVALPRHRRSDEVIKLRGRIHRDAGDYGGRFTSHLVLDEPDRPDIYKQWFDFYFVGKDRFTIWNAEIVTARRAFWDAANGLAYDRADALRTPEECEAEAQLEFEPASYSRTGKVLTYQMVKREPVRYAQFGGMTFFEKLEALEAEIVRNEPPIVFESFSLDRSYVYGIGLRIVLDVEIIDRAAIDLAIDRFQAVGETDWRAAEPVPRERLPGVSEHEAFATLKQSSAPNEICT